jgi:hypothetical protein
VTSAFRVRISAASAAAVLLLLTVGAVVGGNAAAATAPPFDDPNAIGTLTFCNQAEQPITSGSLLSAPFVWTAVSSAPAPQGYSRAYLAAYQPIQFVDPGDWSGSQLTEPAVFSNPQHPIAQAIGSDSPLLWFIQKAPPHWDGLVQIRMFFTAPRQPVDTSPYPAAIIKITGNNWTLVSGGAGDCKVGRAVSTWGGEGGSNKPRTITVTGASQTVPPTGGAHTGESSATTSKPAGDGSNGSTGSRSDSSTSAASPTTTHSHGAAAIGATGSGSSGSGSSGLWIGLAVALVVIAAGGGAVIWRRHTKHAGATPQSAL